MDMEHDPKMTSFDFTWVNMRFNVIRLKADLTVNLANCVKDSYTVKELKVLASNFLPML